jgi:SNF2 family DNA or RNA helicase
MIYDDILFDYQREAVDRLAGQKVVLLADQPGLGKTLEVLGALEKLGLFDDPDALILILSPVVACQTAWRDSIERFVLPYHGVDFVDLSVGSASDKDARLREFMEVESVNGGLILANHAVMDLIKGKLRVPYLDECVFDAVVIDESHLVLPILNDRKLTNFWKGLRSLDYVDVRFAVSGTPDRGKLENRFGTYRFLFPQRFHGVSRWNWLEEHFHVYDQKVSKSRTVKKVGQLKRPADWALVEDNVIVRRTKSEVLTSLPEKMYNFVEVRLGKEQRKQYMSALVDAVEQKVEAQENDRESAAAMVFSLRGRQIASCSMDENWMPVVGGPSVKLDWLEEWLAEREQVKVVIASQFVKVLEWLRIELVARGYSAEVLHGGLSAQRRADIQREFQTGALEIVLLSGRMGVGITLDAADDLIMFDQPYDPDMVEQIEDRVHRASRNHQVTIWNVVAVGTLDQLVVETLHKRYKATRESLDGRRGIDYEKKIVERFSVSPRMSVVDDSVVTLEGGSNGND